MPPPLISNAAMHGFVLGFFHIAWIIIASIFLYKISLETGQFEVMKQSIASLSRDVRVQTVLIAFCFGAFLEGAGGGGAPVAIAGSFLIGLGFPPFQAAVICLIANTAPVAWGGVGNPVRVLAGVTGLPEHAFNAVLGRILPPFALILPLYMMLTCFKSPVLMGAANSAGGVMGKMISPQSLVVAAAATKQTGKEAEMFKAIFGHSLLLAILVGLLVLFYAYVMPGLVSIP